MSGIKQATVSNSLKKTLEIVRRGLSECAERAKKTGDIGKKELDELNLTVKEVSKNLVRELPDEIKAFLNGEDAQFKSLLKRHDLALEEADQLRKDARTSGSEYDQRKAKSDAELSSIQNNAAAIQRKISGRSGYLDSEYAEAKKLRSRAEEILSQMQNNASLCRKEQQLNHQSMEKYNAALKLAQLAQQEYDRLLNLGHDRQEQQRIAEENKRNALMLNGDLQSLKRRIENRNYAKFGNGAYVAAEKKELDALNSLIESGKYEETLARAAVLKKKLTEAAQKIEDAQLAWETAKHNAETALANARKELAGMVREDLDTYSGRKVEEIQSLYDAVDRAESQIENEAFVDASAGIEHAVGELRNVAETTASNKSKAQQREELVQCIAQALYDANYDEPVVYQDDNAGELDILYIKANAPDHVADFEMKVDLSGKVDFVVENVPEGQESLCIDAIRKLQEKLGPEVKFEVTHWGRANNPDEHLGIPDPPKIIRIREREKQGQ